MSRRRLGPTLSSTAASRKLREVTRTARMLVAVLSLAAVLALVPLTGAAASGAADAAGTNAPSRAPALTLVDQTAWVGAGQVFATRVRLPAGHGDGQVDLTLYPALDDPAQVASTARGADLGRRLRRLPSLPVTAATDDLTVRFMVGTAPAAPAGPGSTATGGGAAAATPSVDLEPGVYPLEVVLSGSGLQDDAHLVTHVVVLTAGQVRSRPVGLVVPMDQVFGWTADRGLQVVGDPGQLARETAPLRAHPEVPLTLAPTPGTLTALQSTPAGSDSVASLVALSRTSQVLNGPFAPLVAGAWVTAGLDQPLVDQFSAGQAALTSTLGGAPTGSTWLVSPTDNPSLLRWQAARGVRTFLVPEVESPPNEPFHINEVDAPHVAIRLERAVDGGDRATDSSGTDAGGTNGDVSPPDGAAASGGPQPAGGSTTRADPADVPTGTDVPTVADAYRLLARLALPAVSGDVEDPPPVAVLVDDLRPEAAAFLTALLQGLSEGGPLQPSTVDGLNADVERRPTASLPGWSLPEPRTTGVDGLESYLRTAQAAVSSFRATAGADDPALASLQYAILALGHPAASRVQRDATVRALDQRVRDELDTVVLDRDQPITVTGHQAELPLTVHNRGRRDLTVSLATTSSDLEVQGPTTRAVRLPAGGSVDVLVPVKVNRSGDFRLDVNVSSADGRLALAERSLTVRSTAISGVGVVLSLGALLFLFGWWGRQIRRTRRARRPPAQAPAEQAEPGRVGEPVR